MGTSLLGGGDDEGLFKHRGMSVVIKSKGSERRGC
jgi:hypothetical protein